MGESLGQWKARPNSSNWDTLPSTLGQEKRPSHLERVPGGPDPPAAHPPSRLLSPQTQGGEPQSERVGAPVVLGGMLVSQHLQVDGL